VIKGGKNLAKFFRRAQGQSSPELGLISSSVKRFAPIPAFPKIQGFCAEREGVETVTANPV